MYVALTLARSNCYYAAWALNSESADFELAAATARVSSTKAFNLCSQENIQTHGRCISESPALHVVPGQAAGFE